MRRSLGYAILGYDEPNPAANQQIRQPAEQNFDQLGRGPYVRLVRSRREPNILASVKMLSLTIRGGGVHREMRFPQCQHQGG